jgi:hypothetical protein
MSQFAVCIRNNGCEDLQLQKVYSVLPDEKADRVGYLRVIDDSGEDYLYPAEYFALTSPTAATPAPPSPAGR